MTPSREDAVRAVAEALLDHNGGIDWRVWTKDAAAALDALTPRPPAPRPGGYTDTDRHLATRRGAMLDAARVIRSAPPWGSVTQKDEA